MAFILKEVVLREVVLKEAKLMGLALCGGFIFAFLAMGVSYTYARVTQQNIASNVIRFHVRAHSDADIDQDLKYMVRDKVLAKFEPTLSTLNTRELALDTIENQLDEIEAYVKNILETQGVHKDVAVRLAHLFFPMQSYGAIIFPSGMYDGLEIVLGAGLGSNWWCMMFPPLCYVDMAATPQSQQLLATNLSTESMRLVMHQENQAPTVAVRFRVVEWWQSRSAPAQPVLTPVVAR